MKFVLFAIACLYYHTIMSQSFAPMEDGFNGIIRSLVYDSINNVLYAGGDFTFQNIPADSSRPVNRVARWNGTSWDSLGSGVTLPNAPHINDMDLYNGDLVICGTFNIVGGIQSKGVALWNGMSWQHFADVVSNGSPAPDVIRLYVNGNDLYIGGNFDSINNISASGIAKYDGLTWTTYPPIGASNSLVAAIIVYNNELYVGGNFSLGPGKADIVKFDGTSWVSVGGGLSGPNSWVYDFTIFQNKLYVAGYFNAAQGDPGNNVAIWDGNSWSQAGLGVQPSTVTQLYEFQSELYAAGSILSAGGNPVSFIAKWDGISWNSLPNNPIFSNITLCLASHDNDLFIGGGFNQVNGMTVNKITRFNTVTGIHSFDDKSGLEIFPNPTESNFTLKFPETVKSSGIIEILNILGEVIFTTKINKGEQQIVINLNQGNFHSAIYNVHTIIDGITYYSKLIVNCDR